jgi:cell division protein FtsB
MKLFLGVAVSLAMVSGLIVMLAAANFVVDTLVYAQAPVAQPTLAPDVQQLVNQIHQVGCSAEETAAAQTIAQLQKQNNDLKAEIQKLDPPKSGATRH